MGGMFGELVRVCLVVGNVEVMMIDVEVVVGEWRRWKMSRVGGRRDKAFEFAMRDEFESALTAAMIHFHGIC